MTAAPEKTVLAPAAQAGAPALARVLEKGEELRRLVHEEISEHKEIYRRNAGGLKVAPLHSALLESVSAERARELAEGYRARPDGEVAEDEGAGEISSEVLYASDALVCLGRAYRRAAFRALAEEREMGDGVVPGLAFERGSYGEACEALGAAADAFPTDWLRLSNAAGPLHATVGRRGLYRSWPLDGHPEGEPCQPLARARVRVDRDAPYANALHELAHRAQDVVPGLALVEGELYRRRTTRADRTRAPARRRPGYRKDDLFRYGGFFSPYCGRDPYLDRELPSPGYELFPMGMEALFGDDLETFELFWLHQDHEHEAFCLGALACL